jgi:hypothetical protein
LVQQRAILESMVELSFFSGNKKYFEYCYVLVKVSITGGPRILMDSEGRVDKVANAKA